MHLFNLYFRVHKGSNSPLLSTMSHSLPRLTRLHSTVRKSTTTGTVASEYVVTSHMASLPPGEQG